MISGQSYVALSRAATMDGLQVLGFEDRKVCYHLLTFDITCILIYSAQVKAHAKVIEWNSGLERLSEVKAFESG